LPRLPFGKPGKHPFCHCEPAEGGRGNLGLFVIASLNAKGVQAWQSRIFEKGRLEEPIHKMRLARLSALADRLASMGIGF